jgi:hypothetical protein
MNRLLWCTIAGLHAAHLLVAQQPAPGRGALRGTVLSSVDSSPLWGAQVALDLNHFGVADSLGQFAIDTIPAGTYSLSVRAFKYHDSQRPVEIRADTMQLGIIVLRTECRFDSTSAVRGIRQGRPKIVFNGGLAPTSLSQEDYAFERAYRVKYVILGDGDPEPAACAETNNRVVFRFLDRRFGLEWRARVRHR